MRSKELVEMTNFFYSGDHTKIVWSPENYNRYAMRNTLNIRSISGDV